MTEEQRIQSIREKGGQTLRYYKRENITYAMCLAAVTQDGSSIYEVPLELRTDEIYLTAVKTCGEVIRIMPEELLTQELCDSVVYWTPELIQYVPEKYLTESLCREAVSHNSELYKYVPLTMITPAFCVKAGINHLPKQFKKTAFYAQIIALDPDYLWHIPEKNRTIAICKDAIQRKGYTQISDAVRDTPGLLGLLPQSLYTHDVCITYAQVVYGQEDSGQQKGSYSKIWNVYTDPFDGIYVDKLLSWKDVCQIVIPNDGVLIRCASEEVLTEDICLAAVRDPRCSLKYIPEKFRSLKLCMSAIKVEPWNIEYTPTEFLTQDVYADAVSRYGALLEDVPQKWITYEMCLNAAKNCYYSIDYMPERFITEEICLELVKNRCGLYRIPEQHRTADVCMEAVRCEDIHVGAAIKWIPEDILTQEMCNLSVRTKITSVADIPPKFLTDEILLYVAREAPGYLQYCASTRPWSDSLVERMISEAENEDAKKEIEEALQVQLRTK